MIVKLFNNINETEYINTDHIVLMNSDEHKVRFTDGTCLFMDKEVFEKLLEIWIADETWAGICYKEISVDHSTTISVSEVREQC